VTGYHHGNFHLQNGESVHLCVQYGINQDEVLLTSCNSSDECPDIDGSDDDLAESLGDCTLGGDEAQITPLALSCMKEGYQMYLYLYYDHVMPLNWQKTTMKAPIWNRL